MALSVPFHLGVPCSENASIVCFLAVSIQICVALSPWLSGKVGNSDVGVRCVVKHCLLSSVAEVAGVGPGHAVASHKRT